MIVTAADARVLIVDALDALIRDRLAALDTAIRSDLASTGPEPEDQLDAPPAGESDWTRVSVEEIVVMERARLESWRDALLELFDSRASTT